MPQSFPRMSGRPASPAPITTILAFGDFANSCVALNAMPLEHRRGEASVYGVVVQLDTSGFDPQTFSLFLGDRDAVDIFAFTLLLNQLGFNGLGDLGRQRDRLDRHIIERNESRRQANLRLLGDAQLDGLL